MQITLKCNHCDKSVEYNNHEPGNMKKMYEDTGFLMIPLHKVSSIPGPLYCKDCIELISECKFI